MTDSILISRVPVGLESAAQAVGAAGSGLGEEVLSGAARRVEITIAIKEVVDNTSENGVVSGAGTAAVAYAKFEATAAGAAIGAKVVGAAGFEFGGQLGMLTGQPEIGVGGALVGGVIGVGVGTFVGGIVGGDAAEEVAKSLSLSLPSATHYWDNKIQDVINASDDPGAGIRIPEQIRAALNNGYSPDALKDIIGSGNLDKFLNETAGNYVPTSDPTNTELNYFKYDPFTDPTNTELRPLSDQQGGIGDTGSGYDTNGANPMGGYDGTNGNGTSTPSDNWGGGYDVGGSSPSGDGSSPSDNWGGGYDVGGSSPSDGSSAPSDNPDNSNTENQSSGINKTSEDDRPVLLDLTGHGISIAELTRSTKFLDADGTGLSHRTAWAGVGSGVLFFDPGSTGQITQKNQYVFTEWDKTAKGDLEALLNVFDSNGDGKLDASDAKFSLFKVMVSNADGTYTAKTLTELGITSINLKADLTNITYADGSKITGQTTFTKSDGTTGTVANTSLAYDATGDAVSTVVTSDANGNRVGTATGLSADGSIASVDTTTTSPDGSSITHTYDTNGDGVVDHIQVITTATDALGTVTETITNSDGKQVTVNRDTTGGGWVNEREQRATGVDGHRSVVVTALNADGHEITSSSDVAANDNHSMLTAMLAA